MKFYNNIALTGIDVYIDIPTLCDENCLNSSIIGISKANNLLADHITTPPSKLEFDDIKCDNEFTSTNCYIKNVMLGQEIIISACIRDYYDRPADATLFVVDGRNQEYRINGKHVLVSCTVFQGISVVGKRASHVTNFSITITSNHGSRTHLKIIKNKSNN